MFPGELKDINTVLAIGERWGYGNMIYHLQNAWSERLQQRSAIDEYGASMAAGLICAWCLVDKRTGKKRRR